MKKLLPVLQYGLTAILVIFAIFNSYKEYDALKAHMEWSASTYVIWIKLAGIIIFAIIIFCLLGYLRKRIGG